VPPGPQLSGPTGGSACAPVSALFDLHVVLAPSGVLHFAHVWSTVWSLTGFAVPLSHSSIQSWREDWFSSWS
jgi:hypothetical protein